MSWFCLEKLLIYNKNEISKRSNLDDRKTTSNSRLKQGYDAGDKENGGNYVALYRILLPKYEIIFNLYSSVEEKEDHLR